jgi:hypothetical protein
MQSIMTKYVLHLSKIASKEAEFDPEMEHEVWKQNRQKAERQAKVTATDEVELEKELEDVPEYTVDPTLLRPVKKAG